MLHHALSSRTKCSCCTFASSLRARLRLHPLLPQCQWHCECTTPLTKSHQLIAMLVPTSQHLSYFRLPLAWNKHRIASKIANLPTATKYVTTKRCDVDCQASFSWWESHIIETNEGLLMLYVYKCVVVLQSIKMKEALQWQNIVEIRKKKIFTFKNKGINNQATREIARK